MLEKFPKIVFWNVGTVEKSFQNSKIKFFANICWRYRQLINPLKLVLYFDWKKENLQTTIFFIPPIDSPDIWVEKESWYQNTTCLSWKVQNLKNLTVQGGFLFTERTAERKKGIWEKQTRFKIVSCIFNVIQHTLKWIYFVSLFLVLSMYMGNFLRTMCG